MSKSAPRRQFLALSGSSLAATVFASSLLRRNRGDIYTRVAGENPEINLLAEVKRLEIRFYDNAVSGPERGGGGSPVAFSDPVVARYARELAEDKAGHLAVLAAATLPERPIDLGSRPFSRIAEAAGLIAPGAVFDPYRDDDAFLLAAHMLETACAPAYRCAAPRGLEDAGPLTPIFADAGYHAGLVRTALAARAVAGADRIPAALDRLAGGGPAAPGVHRALDILRLGEGRRGGFFPAGPAMMGWRLA